MGGMFNPLITCKFDVSFLLDTGLSYEYSTYLKHHIKKTKVNLVKNKLEIWLMVPEEGPMHELIKWFSTNQIDIQLRELAASDVARIITLKQAKVCDHEIVYDYSSAAPLTSYTVWEFQTSEV